MLQYNPLGIALRYQDSATDRSPDDKYLEDDMVKSRGKETTERQTSLSIRRFTRLYKLERIL